MGQGGVSCCLPQTGSSPLHWVSRIFGGEAAAPSVLVVVVPSPHTERPHPLCGGHLDIGPLMVSRSLVPPWCPVPPIDALVLQSSASLLLRSSHGLVGLRPPQPGLLGGLRSQKTPAVGSFLPAQHPTLGDLVDVCKRRPAHTAEHPSIQFDPVHT